MPLVYIAVTHAVDRALSPASSPTLEAHVYFPKHMTTILPGNSCFEARGKQRMRTKRFKLDAKLFLSPLSFLTARENWEVECISPGLSIFLAPCSPRYLPNSQHVHHLLDFSTPVDHIVFQNVRDLGSGRNISGFQNCVALQIR